MRIIIETDAAAAQPRVSYESPGETAREQRSEARQAAPEAAINGGQPAEELLSALGALEGPGPQAGGDASDGVRRAGEDAGGAPSWLVGVIEGGAENRRRMQ